jgi:hypothetical protein
MIKNHGRAPPDNLIFIIRIFNRRIFNYLDKYAMETDKALKEKLLPLLGTGPVRLIAKKLGLSESALRRAMKRLRIRQPRKYLRSCRLSASKLGGEAARRLFSNPEACKARYRKRNAARQAGYYARFSIARSKKREENQTATKNLETAILPVVADPSAR